MPTLSEFEVTFWREGVSIVRRLYFCSHPFMLKSNRLVIIAISEKIEFCFHSLKPQHVQHQRCVTTAYKVIIETSPLETGNESVKTTAVCKNQDAEPEQRRRTHPAKNQPPKSETNMYRATSNHKRFYKQTI
jgi:hypothetical protein